MERLWRRGARPVSRPTRSRPWLRALAPAAVVALVAVAMYAGAWLLPLRPSAAKAPVPLTPEEQEIKRAIQTLWQREDRLVALGEVRALPGLFDPATAGGRAALAHAEARLRFVQAWARARGVRWLVPVVTVRTPRIRVRAGTAVATAIISEAWTYVYTGAAPIAAPRPHGPGPAPFVERQTFGLGREHYLTLARTGNIWRIAGDDFTDPLDQDTRIPEAARPALPLSGAGGGSGGPGPKDAIPGTTATRPASPWRSAAVSFVGFWSGILRGSYDRVGAVRYADAYCGAAPGCGHDGRYNPRFYNYNGEGGDCTNFVSQALSLGGHLRRTAAWTYDGGTGEGTADWVKSSQLVDHLLGNGLATIIARGRYPQVAPQVSRLQPGDVIAYVEHGKVVHLALVIGFDPHGYALVDSHTADRYHVPWDIGWDRRASFVFLHIRDATSGLPTVAGLPVFAAQTACGGP